MDQHISNNFKSIFIERLLKWIEAGLKNPDHMSFITPSQMMITNAFDEANVDVNFLRSRRVLKDGISEGKLAGAIVFRFCRNKFLHLSYPICDDEYYINLQERAVINTVLEILRIDVRRILIRVGAERISGTQRRLQNVMNELIYMISSRHSNQEALALFFDTLCHLDGALRHEAEQPDVPTCDA